MTDRVLAVDRASDRFNHIENLIQQLDDHDLDEAVALIEALLDRRYPGGSDGPVRQLVPVSPRPLRPSPVVDD